MEFSTNQLEMLTIQEAAKEANVTEAAIRNAILRGRLPYLQRYGRKLIERAEFEKYRRIAKPGRPITCGRRKIKEQQRESVQ